MSMTTGGMTIAAANGMKVLTSLTAMGIAAVLNTFSPWNVSVPRSNRRKLIGKYGATVVFEGLSFDF